jgi:hypothetical protein
MRTLILIAALLLASASASAQAGDTLLLAPDAAPPARSTNYAEPLPPVAKDDQKDEKAEQAKPQAVEPVGAAQVRAAEIRMEARRSQEAKARRVAAGYGF